MALEVSAPGDEPITVAKSPLHSSTPPEYVTRILKRTMARHLMQGGAEGEFFVADSYVKADS
jgi:hypothetical protein